MATDLEQLISFANQNVTNRLILDLMVESKKHGFDDKETALIIPLNESEYGNNSEPYIRAAFEAKEKYGATYEQLALMLESDRDFNYSMEADCWVQMIKDNMSFEDIQNIDNYVNEQDSMAGKSAIFAVEHGLDSADLNYFTPSQLTEYMDLYSSENFEWALNNDFLDLPGYRVNLSPSQIEAIKDLSDMLYSHYSTAICNSFGQQLCQFIMNHNLNHDNFNIFFQQFDKHTKFKEENFSEDYDKLLHDTDANKYFEVELIWGFSLETHGSNVLNEHIPDVSLERLNSGKLILSSPPLCETILAPSQICETIWDSNIDYNARHDLISALLFECCDAVNMTYGDRYQHRYTYDEMHNMINNIANIILTIPSIEEYKDIYSGILTETAVLTLEGIPMKDAFDIVVGQFEENVFGEEKDYFKNHSLCTEDVFNLSSLNLNATKIACIGQAYRADVPNDVISICMQNGLRDEYDYNEVIQAYEDGLRGDDLLSICKKDLNPIERCERRVILSNNLDKSEKETSEQAIG